MPLQQFPPLRDLLLILPVPGARVDSKPILYGGHKDTWVCGRHGEKKNEGMRQVKEVEPTKGIRKIDRDRDRGRGRERELEHVCGVDTDRYRFEIRTI